MKLNIGRVLEEFKQDLLVELEKKLIQFLRQNLKPMVIKILSDLLDVDDEGNVVITDKSVK